MPGEYFRSLLSDTVNIKITTLITRSMGPMRPVDPGWPHIGPMNLAIWVMRRDIHTRLTAYVLRTTMSICDRYGVSNHQQLDILVNSLFRLTANVNTGQRLKALDYWGSSHIIRPNNDAVMIFFEKANVIALSNS